MATSIETGCQHPVSMLVATWLVGLAFAFPPQAKRHRAMDFPPQGLEIIHSIVI